MKKVRLSQSVMLLLGLLLASCSSSDVNDLPEVVKPVTEDNSGKTSDNQEQNTGEETPTNTGEETPTNTGGDENVTLISLTDAEKQAVSNNNDFAFNFFRQASKPFMQEGKSLVVSPLSVTYALGMLNSGAQGKTAEELTSVLGFNGCTSQAVDELCQEIIENAPHVDSQVNLKLANCIVANQGTELAESYQQNMERYYQAEVFNKDFALPATVDFINDWCKKQTEGMIDRIISELKPLQRLLLMNAVYFKASWSGKFKKEDTKQETFTLENGSSVQVPMMHRTDGTEYAAADGYAAIGLPYGKGKNWRMYVLLPSAGKTVGDVLKGLTNASWQKTLQQMKGELVDVKLPKFKTEYEEELNDVLKSLGATKLFDAGDDFIAMTKNATPLSVSLIKQKTVIEVSEEGTEASAVTIDVLDAEDLGDDNTGGKKIMQFHATRPFVYLIQEATSGAVFFIGTYYGQ